VVNAAGSGTSRKYVILSEFGYLLIIILHEEEQGLPVLPSGARRVGADDTQYCN